MQLPTLNTIGDQIIKAIMNLRQAPKFIMDNKLWRGYISIGWISKLSLFIAIVFSYTFITGIIGLFISPDTTGIVQEGSLSFFNKLEDFGDILLFSGSMKYLILILIETIIFHFAVKTQEILSGEKRELTVKDFIAAQIRMIKVAIRSWIFELIISAILIFILRLIGLNILSTVVFFGIQSYFLGLAFIDNYNEQYKISIKESFNIAYDHIGAAIVVGIVAYILFLIPLFGIIITPFICAVGTTTYMYYSKEEQTSK
ncbi:MAG: hypothetical protein ACI94Y_000348 [Maribacter sp.]|jgi:hypothetical protein